MISVNTFFEKINYKEIVALLVDAMSENSADFSADLERFNQSISILENELNNAAAPSVEDVVAAIDRQIGFLLLFSCCLGLKANLDHFNYPIGRTFLDVDTETYLREDIAMRLPDYQNAQVVREQFYATLTTEQQGKYEDIITYICHLETIGPKLAHYYGYMLGNQLFPHIIPGYSEDLHLTFQYQNMLEEYLGVSIK